MEQKVVELFVIFIPKHQHVNIPHVETEMFNICGLHFLKKGLKMGCLTLSFCFHFVVVTQLLRLSVLGNIN